MSAAVDALTLELLGVPIVLCVPAGELARRAGAAYAPLRSEPAPDALVARCTPCAAGFRLEVDGRAPLERADEVEALRTLNHELLQALMRRRPEHYYVHAAVLEHGGRALVLPGLSRAGKSTLALALVLAGARYLSDELLCLARDGRALAVPRAPKLRDECVAYFPGLAAACVGTGEGRFVPFEALPAGTLGAPAPVGTIAVPRWTPDGDDRARALGRGEALLALTRSSLNFGAHRAASLDWLTGLVGGARTFALAWKDPHAAAAALLAEHGR